MAKKRASKVETVKVERTTKAVRLELNTAEFDQLDRCAGFVGITKAAYARMAVKNQIRADLERIMADIIKFKNLDRLD